MVTEISSTPVPSSDTPSWALSWDTTEMLSYIEKGICKQVETTERIGIQPFWIKNIEVGAMEELRCELGKWSKKHQGYLLGFRRPVQLPDFGMQGRHPQPFLYYRFKVVRYLYTPTESQQLRGVITQFGQKAANCIVFDKFIATVYPKDEKEFNGWNIGDEIDFSVESFEKLQRGVTVKGKSLGGKVKKSSKRKLKVEPVEEDDSEVPASVVQSAEIVNPSEESEPPKKKRKKKSKTVDS